MKVELEQKAQESFAIHTRLDRIYLTEDCQVFAEEHRASAHAGTIDSEVYPFDRTAEAQDKPEPAKDEERETLIAEYVKLFDGKKPPHNISNKTLKERIESKKDTVTTDANSLDTKDTVTTDANSLDAKDTVTTDTNSLDTKDTVTTDTDSLEDKDPQKTDTIKG